MYGTETKGSTWEEYFDWGLRMSVKMYGTQTTYIRNIHSSTMFENECKNVWYSNNEYLRFNYQRV